jgi:hypothetical protein
LRVQDATDSDIAHLNSKIDEAIRVSSCKKRANKLATSSYKNNPGKHWSLVKLISGKNTCPPPNQPIKFRNKVQTEVPRIAKNFCKQYASVAPHKSSKKNKKVLCKMRSKQKLTDNFKPFLVANVEDAIKESKSLTAVGPDGLTAIHFKHLGLSCLLFLLSIGSPP